MWMNSQRMQTHKLTFMTDKNREREREGERARERKETNLLSFWWLHIDSYRKLCYLRLKKLFIQGYLKFVIYGRSFRTTDTVSCDFRSFSINTEKSPHNVMLGIANQTYEYLFRRHLLCYTLLVTQTFHSIYSLSAQQFGSNFYGVQF